ncbi:methionyl-tRNA formyltransferase [Flavobacteriaceae bacterium]|nr:methionyl-tRNA formyltransferase [Flavobacteriaceae bacterium]MDC1543955.1 methionyl-tRNA formyltransferase [Flavobacteriaceae bacterium]
MNKFLLLSNKSWHESLFKKLNSSFTNSEWIHIKSDDLFTLEKLNEIQPKIIFIPHWSKIISEEIYSNFKCILFHMTDLPYGRGGSPLQNLILRDHKTTKISAIKVTKGIDEGPIYLKKDLDLSGTAEQIFIRSSNIIYSMITEIISKSIIPKKQLGKVTNFTRRNPNQSDISKLDDLNKLHNFIRMLDCDGYPKAFIETRNFRLEFEKSELIDENNLTAKVNFKRKK